MKDTRIAAVTFNSPLGKTDENLSRMEVWVKKAKSAGASIVCFPEMNITGYKPNEDIQKIAECIPGNITSTLQKSAKKNHIGILAGMAEKNDKGQLFASHLFIEPDANIGTYRKLHLAPMEQPVFSCGNEIPIFKTEEIKFGVQLCYDAHFPDLSTQMALKQADVIFMPHASPRGTPEDKYHSWVRHLTARAYDNSVFIIVCNQVGNNGYGLQFPGVSVVINPSGEIIEKSLSVQESMIVVDLKAKDLNRVRNHKMRYFLPNRRSDIYSM